MVRHRRRNHRDHEPVTQRSRMGSRRQARRTPLPSGHNQEVVEPPGAPVWSVVSAPVPSALSGQRPRGSASRDRFRDMVCNRQHRQRASYQQHPKHPDGNREMNIVRVAQAISTEAHTGVFRSCGDLYINHPAVGAARLAAFVSVLRQSSLAGCTTRSTKAPGLRSGSSAPPGFPKHHPLPWYRCPPGELCFGLVARAAVDPIGQVRETRRQRRGQRR